MTSDSPAARAIRMAVIVFFLALIVWRTFSVDLLVFAGIVFAVFLSKSSYRVARLLGWRYRICLALVAAAVAILVAGVIWFLALGRQSIRRALEPLDARCRPASPKAA